MKRNHKKLDELQEHLIKNGSDIFSIYDYTESKVKQNTYWWLRAWAITVVLSLIIICSK